MIDLEIAQDRRVETVELIAQPLAPEAELVAGRVLDEIIFAGPEHARSCAGIAHGVDADILDGHLRGVEIVRIARQGEARLGRLGDGIGARRDDVFRADPVRAMRFNYVAREGVEFAHQRRQQAELCIEPEDERAGIHRRHPHGLGRHRAREHGASIFDGEEIAEIADALGRIDQTARRPDHVLSC